MINDPKTHAIARLARSPGYREMLEVLDQLTEQIRNEAFSCDDDSRALRLLHEGRGATKLSQQFKSTIAQYVDAQEQPF